MKEQKLTKEEILKLFKEGFDEKSLSKFYAFLEERKQTDLYFNAVMNTYNRREDPTYAFSGSVVCAFRDEAELGSCFVEFDTSKEGRDFWVEFNAHWQHYR
jgi:hypothetical protein